MRGICALVGLTAIWIGGCALPNLLGDPVGAFSFVGDLVIETNSCGPQVPVTLSRVEVEIREDTPDDGRVYWIRNGSPTISGRRTDINYVFQSDPDLIQPVPANESCVVVVESTFEFDLVPGEADDDDADDPTMEGTITIRYSSAGGDFDCSGILDALPCVFEYEILGEQIGPGTL